MKYAVVDETTGKIINWSKDFKLMLKFILFYCPAKYSSLSLVRVNTVGFKEVRQYIVYEEV